MAARHWMPFFWPDYFADTRHLTKLQHASYLMLIGHYWMHGGLPDDDRELAQITMSTMAEWLADKPVLQRFFHSGWKHKRIEAELVRSVDNVKRLREAGSKGGQTTAMNREKLKWKNQRLK